MVPQDNFMNLKMGTAPGIVLGLREGKGTYELVSYGSPVGLRYEKDLISMLTLGKSSLGEICRSRLCHGRLQARIQRLIRSVD